MRVRLNANIQEAGYVTKNLYWPVINPRVAVFT